MRVISQDGKFDIPYETSVFWVDKNAVFCLTSGCEVIRAVGTYDSEGQAKDALNTMLTHYCQIKEYEFLGMEEACFENPFYKMP